MTTIPVMPNLNGFSIHKKPTFATIVRSPPSGREVEGYQYPMPLWEFDLTYEVLRDQTRNQTIYQNLNGFTEFEQISSLFLSLGGPFGRFYYEDLSDNSRTGQLIGTGTGSATTFRICRTLGFDRLSYTEPVGGINTGKAYTVYLNGVAQSPSAFGFDATNKYLVFVTAPSAGVVVTMDFSFYYLCRFIDEKIDFEQFFFSRWAVQSLKFRSLNDDGLGTNAGNVQPITKTTQVDMPGPWPPDNPGSFYFEVTVDSFGTVTDGEMGVTFGFATLGFNINQNFQRFSHVPGIYSDFLYGTFYQARPAGFSSWAGTGSTQPFVPGGFETAGHTFGIAVNSLTGLFWMRDVANPTAWYAGGSPVLGTSGNVLTGLDDTSRLAIIVGLWWNQTASTNVPSMTINTVGGFGAPPPTGYVSWGPGVIQPGHNPELSIISPDGKTLIGTTFPNGDIDYGNFFFYSSTKAQGW